MKILLVIDYQRDFATPAGTLYVEKGERIAPAINKLLDDDQFDLKIATRDWHPKDHISFAMTHGAGMYTVRETMMGFPGKGTKAIGQMMWPNHCVANTPGAEIYEIDQGKFDAIFNKGRSNYAENYSIFSYVEGTKTEFVDMLQYKNPEEIVICGLALDFCVKFTALDAVKFFPGAKVKIVNGATKAVYPENEEAIKAELTAAGVIFETYYTES